MDQPMNLVFIPEPKHFAPGKGYFHIPASGAIAIPGADLFPVAQEARSLFKRHDIGVVLPASGAS